MHHHRVLWLVYVHLFFQEVLVLNLHRHSLGGGGAVWHRLEDVSCKISFVTQNTQTHAENNKTRSTFTQKKHTHIKKNRWETTKRSRKTRKSQNARSTWDTTRTTSATPSQKYHTSDRGFHRGLGEYHVVPVWFQ